MKQGQPCEVTWVDAEATNDVVDSSDRTYKPLVQHSVGYFHWRSDDVLIIAMSWDVRADGREQMGDRLIIPAVLVKSVRALK